MRGTGKADVFVMLSHPVSHAKSPGIFNEIFEARGLDSLMVPMSCKPEDFDAFWVGLSAAENVLESGVEIFVQPPGKRRQNLALLSGGERALTVISILFAFLAYRPAPFCVVDEIDSALDEANVRRFSEFLTEYSKRSQFIVVTHRKGTMEAADILHGVTMEDSGVSRLVSVKFTEDGKPKEEERMMRGTI